MNIIKNINYFTSTAISNSYRIFFITIFGFYSILLLNTILIINKNPYIFLFIFLIAFTSLIIGIYANYLNIRNNSFYVDISISNKIFSIVSKSGSNYKSFEIKDIKSYYYRRIFYKGVHRHDLVIKFSNDKLYFKEKINFTSLDKLYDYLIKMYPDKEKIPFYERFFQFLILFVIILIFINILFL